MEDFEQKKLFNKHERIARLVEEGSKSEYWVILKSEVDKHIAHYENYLDRLNHKRLTPKDLDERNDMIFQLKFMKWFLNINEKIMQDQTNFFSKLSSNVENIYKRAESFVK